MDFENRRRSNLFSNCHVVEEPSKFGIGIDTEGISHDPSRSTITLDGIDDRHVIRIAYSLETMVFHDGEFVSLERFAAVHIQKGVIEKREVCGEPSFLQSLNGFDHGCIATGAHGTPPKDNDDDTDILLFQLWPGPSLGEWGGLKPN